LREAKETGHRFYPIWTLALMTGMRSGELVALQWTDIDFEGQTISVSKQWTNKNGIGPTKTQRCRVVPISSDLLLFLKELRLKSESEFVLTAIRMGARRAGSSHQRVLCKHRNHTCEVPRPPSDVYHQFIVQR